MTEHDVYECMVCETADARPDSHFCSDACRKAWAESMPFVLACGGSKGGCSADEGEYQTVEEAHAAGWEGIMPDTEGSMWNYIGTCPECKEE
jgi:hypothetical protein